MFLKQNLFVIFSAFTLASSIFVVWAKNPIFSVLFLIFSFFNVSAILFLFNFEFLPIAFLVVYVGAVAVLFLFVLMMLNIKQAELLETYFNVVPLGLFFGIFFTYLLVLLLRFEFEIVDSFDKMSIIFLLDFSNALTIKTGYLNLCCSFTNMKGLAVALFSDFLLHFLVSGMVLLLAMIAAIILTLQKFFISKNQNVYNQILKDFNFAISTSS